MILAHTVTMYYLKLHIVLLLYGFSYSHGFFHFGRQDELLIKYSESFNESTGTELYFEQLIDHFNPSDKRTWQQKYRKDIGLWKPGGPIFLYINGEGALPTRELLSKYTFNNFSSGSVVNDLIEETSAAFFMLEHRYYGVTKPFDEPTTENLAFLTSKQALADTALFLQSLKSSSEFTNSKVMIVGGSYAGNLAAWMKVKYPDLVDAVLSSSAPVLAKKDFYEFYETITYLFRTYGSEECVNQISNEFSTYRQLLQSPEGIERLKEEQDICKQVDMTVPENQQLFFFNKINGYVIQATHATPSDIAYVCNNLKQPSALLGDSFSLFWDHKLCCYDFNYNESIRNYFRGTFLYWYYQTCTEFGYYQSTTSKKQMFGDVLPVDFFYKTCSVLFGEEFNEQRVDQGVTNTNNMYGGLTPNVKNVVFVNGDMDPWHRLGVLKDLSADVPAIYIKGSSHCNDLDLYKEDDIDSVKEARIKTKNLMKQWIGA